MTIVSRPELGELFGLPLSTIDLRVKAGMPYLEKPENGRGQWRFDSADCFEWLMEQVGTKKADPFKDASTREKAASASLKEMELADKMGQTVVVEDVLPLVDAGDAVVRSRVLAIPGRLSQTLAAETDPVVVQRILKEECNAALSELDKHWSERG